MTADSVQDHAFTTDWGPYFANEIEQIRHLPYQVFFRKRG